ncbi:VWA domain-containing protein [Jeotgalibacillus sp. ET6]|uniref:VWA domain-containing protein n=1 Tax=Jeotgalibacillus sp. ET6 TaxID=3037260 RepID=UPI0024184ABB|nr:VWA domain-containing protein [Jeotgalibacillus sp. ET6]MDG5473690.1 VWA domain-containing protein [Jeotgalibacillus sp. ET6]
MKKWMYLLFAAALLSACTSEESENTAQVQEETSEPTEEVMEDVPEKEDGKTVADNQDANRSETVPLAETFEDLTAVSSGKLTSDFTYEKETNVFASANPLDGIEEEFIAQMNEKQEWESAERLLAELHYYLGNGAVGTLAEKLEALEPSFSAPLLPEPEEMKASQEGEEPPAHAMILLDASSSMLLEAGGEQKMRVAKDAVLDFGKTIGAASEVSLYVYGHEGTQEDEDRELSCSVIDETVPMGTYNEEAFYKSVSNIEAKGWTPLAEAIKTAREDSSQYEGKLTVFVVSDGMETCGGDPIAEAAALVKDREDRTVNIIGFSVDAESEEQLKKVAEAGSGEYLGADTAEELQNSMRKTWVPSDMEILNKTLSSPRTGFALPFQKLEINDTAMSLGFALDREKARLKRAVTVMKNEEIISEETAQEATELIDAQDDLKRELIQDKKEEKLSDVEEEADRIDAEINEWAERMEKLKDEQEE